MGARAACLAPPSTGRCLGPPARPCPAQPLRSSACLSAVVVSPALTHTRAPGRPRDAVAEDDLLLQIETDKVTIDVRYQQKEPGVVKEFLVKPDDTVQARLHSYALLDSLCADSGCRPLASCKSHQTASGPCSDSRRG